MITWDLCNNCSLLHSRLSSGGLWYAQCISSSGMQVFIGCQVLHTVWLMSEAAKIIMKVNILILKKAFDLREICAVWMIFNAFTQIAILMSSLLNYFSFETRSYASRNGFWDFLTKAPMSWTWDFDNKDQRCSLWCET